MQESSYPKNSSVYAEIFRAAHICAPCLDRLGRLTFFGCRQSEFALTTWFDDVFSRHLLPAILQVHAAAANQGFRELVAIDTALNSAFVGIAADCSRDAGRMLTSYGAPASERVLARYLNAIASGASPGHFVTLFSARASIFHFSPQMTLAALLFLEMRALPPKELWTAVDICLKRLPSAPSLLHAA